MLRVTGEILLAFSCATPLVLLLSYLTLSNLGAYGVRSFLQRVAIDPRLSIYRFRL
jgi:hypothetical protein